MSAGLAGPGLLSLSQALTTLHSLKERVHTAACTRGAHSLCMPGKASVCSIPGTVPFMRGKSRVCHSSFAQHTGKVALFLV